MRSEFCPYVELGRRCVAPVGHYENDHDLQPIKSVTVQAVLRQERFDSDDPAPKGIDQ